MAVAMKRLPLPPLRGMRVEEAVPRGVASDVGAPLVRPLTGGALTRGGPTTPLDGSRGGVATAVPKTVSQLPREGVTTTVSSPLLRVRLAVAPIPGNALVKASHEVRVGSLLPLKDSRIVAILAARARMAGSLYLLPPPVTLRHLGPNGVALKSYLLILS